MRLFLIRHAQAGDRTSGQRDRYRQLTAEGHDRAGELARLLADQGITRILTSPATRCIQTVAPLGQALGLELEEDDELWEGTPTPAVLARLEPAGGATGALAACSHGDVIPEVVEAVARAGAVVSGRGCAKGSIWVLEHDGSAWVRATYHNRSVSALPPAP